MAETPGPADHPRSAASTRSTPSWTGGLLPAATGWVAARLLVTLGHVVGHLLAGRMDGAEAETARSTLGDGLFIWDGMFYRDIAFHWYLVDRPDAARFFPLYPAIAHVLGPLFGDRNDIVLVVVNNVAAFAAAVVLWQLAREVIGDRAVADRAAWMVAVLPSAFVLAMAYTEGLALLFAASTLLALHRRQLVVAGLLAFGAAMLRPVGGLLLVPILVEVWQHRAALSWRAVFALAAPLSGFAVAMWWISLSYDDLLIAFTSQQAVRGGFQDPFTRVLEPIGEILTGRFDDALNLVFMWILIALFVVAVRRRQPLSWLLFAAASLVATFSAQVTDSVGRYGIVVVPLVVALAQWARHRWQQVCVAVIGSTGLVLLAAFAWIGVEVP